MASTLSIEVWQLIGKTEAAPFFIFLPFRICCLELGLPHLETQSRTVFQMTGTFERMVLMNWKLIILLKISERIYKANWIGGRRCFFPVS